MTGMISKNWTRIGAWSLAQFPALVAGLQSGISPQDFERDFADIPAACSQQMADFYQIADGQRDGSVGIFFGMTFMPMAQVRKDVQMWEQIAAEETELGEAEGGDYSSVPEGAVVARYYNPGWIPFAHDYGGNYLAVDCAPGPHGSVGQIINFGRDEYIHRVLAPDLASFLDWTATQLEAGNFRVIEHPEAPEYPYEFLLKEPENQHFLDAIKEPGF